MSGEKGDPPYPVKRAACRIVLQPGYFWSPLAESYCDEQPGVVCRSALAVCGPEYKTARRGRRTGGV